MERVQITLKSGAQIEFDCDELTTGRNQLTNHLSSMNWSTPADWSKKLHLIELEEIAAIVVLRPRPPMMPAHPNARKLPD
jgi:hypothetical protein